MRTRSSIVLTIVIAMVATFATALGASAAPPDHVSERIESHERVSAHDYWTPHRMANARPAWNLVPARRSATTRDVERGQPMQVAPTTPAHHRPSHPGGGGGGGGGGETGPSVSGATWTGGGLVADTTGKVFFTLDGVDYVCSGSSVTSTNESLVLTAGHCLHSGSGGQSGFASNFVFVPAYDGDGRTISGPYGAWAATSLHTTGQWANDEDLDYDVGFARLETKSSGTLSDVVGAQGIAFNQPRGQHYYAFGYPAASPYDGTTLTYCAGTASDDPYGASTQGIVCDMTGGSSGGPWYLDFDEGTGTGIANSLNSYGYTRGRYSDRMYGPYFGSVAQNLYDAAQS